MRIQRAVDGQFSIVDGTGTEHFRGSWSEATNLLQQHAVNPSFDIMEAWAAIDEIRSELAAERAVERYFEERNWTGTVAEDTRERYLEDLEEDRYRVARAASRQTTTVTTYDIDYEPFF